MSKTPLTIRIPVDDIFVDIEQVLKGLPKEHKMRAIALLLGELNNLSDAEWELLRAEWKSLRDEWESCEKRSSCTCSFCLSG
jgi:hypothetical protein